LSLSFMQLIEDEHRPGWIYYVNLEEGVRVEGGLRTASSMTYFKARKINICVVLLSMVQSQVQSNV